MLKKSTLLFLSVFLLSAFSVSPVEAQDQCGLCGSCDRDGDGQTRPTRNCIRKCGGVIDADDNETPNPAICEPEDDPFGLYAVTVAGELSGVGNMEDKASGDWIGLPSPPNIIDMTLNLSFFDDAGRGFGPRATDCFPDTNAPLFAASIMGKKIKGTQTLQAIGNFWFRGCTDAGLDGSDCFIDVDYLLITFGLFSNDDFPPSEVSTGGGCETDDGCNLLTMTDWEMRVESTTGGGRKVACTGEGFFDNPGTPGEETVTTEVRRTQ